ncbi:MAG: O-antigen ligase family protein [Steroidobacteraceae bacterium]
MLTVLIYLVLGANALISLAWPWIGIVLSYIIALLAPQYIWWWAFGGLRPSFWVLAPALAGFLIAAVRGKVNFAPLNTRLNRCVALLWLCATIAYYFGPYVDVVNEWRFYDPEFMFSLMQKTFLTYFVAVLLIDDTRKLKFATVAILVTAAYMIYWANAQYFLYHKFGRIHGPTNLWGQGIYADENDFAVLFVTGFPFLFYLGEYLGNRIVKWALWGLIIFSWHAVFLTASRGALLGIGAVLFVFALRSHKRAVGLAVIVCFVAIYAWQAGDVMKSRSATITTYEQEDSASSRIEAWRAAIGMMAAHPLTGVGFASFGQAFPHFSDKRPRVAHNTFFQIGGEWGIVAAGAYLLLMFSTLNRLRKNGRRLREAEGGPDGRLHLYLNESCLLAMTGFFVCSLFLSLQGYEVLYYLLLVSNATLVCSGYHQSQARSRESPARRIAARRLTARAGVPDARQRVISGTAGSEST